MGKRQAYQAQALLFLCLLATAAAQAEAPVAIAAPKQARSRIVATARIYMGVPYLYGGTNKDGLDCSGLVWRVYVDAFGRAPLGAMPRTARDLFSFVEVEDKAKLQPGDLVFFHTTGQYSHVGIYSGEGSFIHAASDGSRTGVIESSLNEPYWSRHYAAAGRIIPPAEYLGIVVSLGLGADMADDLGFHGLGGLVGISYPLGTGEIGLQVRPNWNAELGVGRLPLVLWLSLDRRLGAFVGPALTFGSPVRNGEGLVASGNLLGTAGLVWVPLRFKLGDAWMGSYLQIVYDRYETSAGEEAKNACLSVGAGIQTRLAF